LSLQVLGENVMLSRVLLEAVGAVARSVGPRFAITGGLLRTVLLPSLERLGEGHVLDVASSSILISQCRDVFPLIQSGWLVRSNSLLMNSIVHHSCIDLKAVWPADVGLAAGGISTIHRGTCRLQYNCLRLHRMHTSSQQPAML
jgi:hypothetical protein